MVPRGVNPMQGWYGVPGAPVQAGFQGQPWAAPIPSAMQPGTAPATPPPVVKPAAAKTVQTPQVRSQIVTGGRDIYRDASPAETTRFGTVRPMYRSGAYATPTPDKLPSAQSGVVAKTPPKDSELSPARLAARQKSRMLARQLRRTV